MTDTKLTAELLDTWEGWAKAYPIPSSCVLSLIAAARASLSAPTETAEARDWAETLVDRASQGWGIHHGHYKALVDAVTKALAQLQADAAAARASLESRGDTATLLKACRWLYERGHKSAATDLDYNWNDSPPGDGSCQPLHLCPSAAGAEPMAGWVAVSERIPEAYELVQFATYAGVCVGSRNELLVWEDMLDTDAACDCEKYDHEQVTHWAPLLPSPPKVTP